MAFLLQRLGNHLFEQCFTIYRPLYTAFKALADRAERQLISTHLRPGMEAVDAGANIGIYSRFIASRVGPTGKVHCFEPSPQNFSRLSAAARSYPQIICNPAAVGAESREMPLYLSASLNVDHRMYAPPDESRERVQIRCVALDDYFPAEAVVNFIKLDIQGFELEALRGAERTLETNREIKLLLEFWPHALKSAGSDPATLPEFLRARGFEIRKIEKPRCLVPLAQGDFALDEGNYCNLFAARA